MRGSGLGWKATKVTAHNAQIPGKRAERGEKGRVARHPRFYLVDI